MSAPALRGPLLLVATCALASTGCAAMKESWDYESVVKTPLSDNTVPSEIVAKQCKVPLRVAVKPFKTSRVGANYGAVGFTGWMLGGIVISPPAGFVAEWSEEDLRKALAMYRQPETRTWAFALYDELSQSGCFDEVAFDPLDESQYDLVFEADVVRHGRLVRFPVVPLPFYVGTIVSLVAGSGSRMIEMDVEARSWTGKPVLDYGFQGTCAGGASGCGQLSATGEITTILHNGYGEMVSRLTAYLASRDVGYWKAVVAARVDQQRAALDPDLPALAAAIRSASGDARAALRAEWDQRAARLDAILDGDRQLEHVWAALSLAILQHQVAKVNDEIDEIYVKRLIATGIGVAGTLVGAGALAAQGGNINGFALQSQMQSNINGVLKDEERVLGWIETLKKELGLSLGAGDPLAGRLDDFAGAVKKRDRQHAEALASYQATRKTPDSLLQPIAPSATKPKKKRNGT